jgi:hypothetical protein
MPIASGTLEELRRQGFETDRETNRAILDVMVRDGLMRETAISGLAFPCIPGVYTASRRSPHDHR